MTPPKVLLDPHWRRMNELFSMDVLADLRSMSEIIWGKDEPMPDDARAQALTDAEVWISTAPEITSDVLSQAKSLRMVIEVEGAFPDTIDYAACAAHGVEVLSCSPGFRQSVAEMGLAMALGAARGLVQEHEAMRAADEHWLEDHAGRDFTLFGAAIGFIGFGQIAQEMTRLLGPFGPDIRAYDPWLPATTAAQFGVQLTTLEEVLSRSRCIFVTAVPTAENRHLLNADMLRLISKGALLILLSRAHLVDFDALRSALENGGFRAAIDVFPREPLDENDPIRKLPGVILSPHRAAAVAGGRQLIGEMIRDDIQALMQGNAQRRLAVADPERIALLAGVGDAGQPVQMALDRK